MFSSGSTMPLSGRCYGMLIGLSLCVLLSQDEVHAQKKTETFFAPRLKAVTVTDSTGTQQRITDVSFSRPSDFQRDYLRGYFQLTTSARKAVWISLACTKQISLSREATPSELNVVVTLVDGNPIKGNLVPKELILSGKGDLGQAKINLSEVTLIECDSFHQPVMIYEYKNNSVDKSKTEYRELQKGDAHRAWLAWRDLKSRKKGGTQHPIDGLGISVLYPDKPLTQWEIQDGESKVITSAIAIWNRYESDRYGSLQAFGTFFYIGEVLESKWPLKRGASAVEASIDECDRIELTGTQTDMLPDIKITKQDGTSISASLALPSINRSKDVVDSEDMIMWETPFGYEGVSLLPNRAVVLRQLPAEKREQKSVSTTASKGDQAEAKVVIPDSKPAPQKPEDDPEMRAAKKLDLAKQLKNKKTRKKWLEEVAKDFPNTEAGKEAAEILKRDGE